MKTLISAIVAIALIGCGEPEPEGDTNIYAQKGDQGDTGDVGPKGDTGAAGTNGITGPKGDTGSTGAKGDTGSAGAKGNTGSQGSIGLQGPQGAAGSQGINGLRGYKGERGERGVRGTRITIWANGVMIGYPVMVDSTGQGTWPAVYVHSDNPPADFPIGGYVMPQADMRMVHFSGSGCTNRAYIIGTTDGTQSPSYNYVNMMYSVEGSDVLWVAEDPDERGLHYESRMIGGICINGNTAGVGVRVKESPYKIDKSGPWWTVIY